MGEKRQKICGDLAVEMGGMESKDAMVVNLKMVIDRMMDMASGGHVAVKNILEEFKKEFGYEFDVKSVAGHGSFTRYVRDQFKSMLKLEIDGKGEYWASSIRPTDSIQGQPGSMSLLKSHAAGCDENRKARKGLEYVQSLYALPKERDNATRVHMLVMRQLLQRKFERWIEVRNQVTEKGGVMPGLKEILQCTSTPTVGSGAVLDTFGLSAGNPLTHGKYEERSATFTRDSSEKQTKSVVRMAYFILHW